MFKRMFRQGFLWRLLALTGLLLGGPVQAVTLEYAASDLPDLVAGQDRWSYQYQLSGSFAPFAGVNLLYPAERYADLALTAPPDPAVWSSLITAPDPSFPADGLLGLTALVATRPLKLPFTLEFTWLGTGSPGAQDFEVLDDGFNVIDRGSSTPLAAPGLPEPGSLLLVAGALALLARRQRRT
ncbi:PEP-CTERM sorting domain-containing protein [Accumulibacter sp.]|uniref:PEP-CTERM sorting domain-containing protein n=1 Tax=Accumulibacter sp. TaxID=2053492 RepID=UPI001A56AF80|nr:PEP-CTERM sorting domain-containing protein [Accumulibacter sp.]MBL8401046.1 PEP-CTERM sorting domain-containing protein [Accumulibacter sp.]